MIEEDTRWQPLPSAGFLCHTQTVLCEELMLCHQCGYLSHCSSGRHYVFMKLIIRELFQGCKDDFLKTIVSSFLGGRGGVLCHNVAQGSFALSQSSFLYPPSAEIYRLHHSTQGLCMFSKPAPSRVGFKINTYILSMYYV